MKAAALHLLLLFGCLQAAIAPAALHGDPGGGLLYRDQPYESLPSPAESTTALKRLVDAPRHSGLPGNWKSLKGVLAATSTVACVRGSATSQTEVAGHTELKFFLLRPIEPRAPPAALPA